VKTLFSRKPTTSARAIVSPSGERMSTSSPIGRRGPADSTTSPVTPGTTPQCARRSADSRTRSYARRSATLGLQIEHRGDALDLIGDAGADPTPRGADGAASLRDRGVGDDREPLGGEGAGPGRGGARHVLRVQADLDRPAPPERLERS